MTAQHHLTTEQKINRFRKRSHDAVHRDGTAERLQHQKQKWTARERIAALLDPGSWNEVDLFAVSRATGLGMEDRRIPTDGVVTGWGTVNGRKLFLFSHDASILGGSLGEVFAEKVTKIMDLAMEVGAPCIGINDSGGARIQEGVAALAGYADIFYRNVQASGVIPQLSLVAGPCTGGAVYSPALTDFITMIRHVGYMFITGPDVVKVTTGEEVSFEELGGADIHNTKSGVAHFVADDERAAIERIKQLLSYLPQNATEVPPYVPSVDDPNRADAQLQRIIPDNAKQPYDMHEVITRVVDSGSFFEVMEHFAENILIGFARLDGHVVGVVGNQPKFLAGVLDIDASVKGARFVRFCDSFNIPLLTFVDVPGFLPGTVQEYGGIIRHGAKLLYAYAEATVPKVTVITRKAYGGAYDVMCSKHLHADMNLAWPTAEIAVMGPEGAANIIYRKEIAKADDPAQRSLELIEEYRERFANPYVAAERGYVDAIIEPNLTRKTLIDVFELLRTKRRPDLHQRHGNIPL